MEEFGHTPKKPGVRCPFYGFAWPAGSPRLLQVAGNRCGLALDRVEPCGMEAAGREIDMEACPTALRLSQFIHLAGPVIAFVTPDHPEGISYTERWRCTMLQPSNSW